MSGLAGGHAFADSCQGAVPALLPFLIADRGLGYAAASALVLAATVSSSVVQPLFGYLSDRRSLDRLMPLGVILAGLGIALAGLAPSYPPLFAAVVLSGLGVAAFHPEAARFANYVSGDRRATGMSAFSLGGNAGFALGPLMVTPAVLVFGLPGTLVVLLPAAVVAVLLGRELPRLRGFRPAGGPSAARTDSERPDAWGPFARLGAVTALRSFVFFGLLTFVPLYFVAELGASKAAANSALTVLLVGGAVGTLIGGRMADRIGRRAVLLGSMAVLPPMVLAFLAAGPGLAFLVLLLVGAATVSTFSVTVVMGQEYLPGRIGVASGVMFGLSIGMGGVGASLLGLVADAYGVTRALEIVAVLPVAGLALTLTLPSALGRKRGDLTRSTPAAPAA